MMSKTLLLVALVLAGCSAAEFQSSREEPNASEWLSCEGYLTRNESNGFCEDLFPEDWEAFQFNGDTYYFVPLSMGSGRLR